MDRNDRFEFDAFFSYGACDEEIALSIVDELEHSGITIWRERKSDGDQVDVVDYALQHSRMFIQVISGGLSEDEIAFFNSYRTRFDDPINKDRYLVLIDIDRKSTLSGTSVGIYLALDAGDVASKIVSILRQERGAYGILTSPPVESIGLRYKKANIRGFSFNKGRSAVASGGFDNIIRMSNLKTGRTIRTLKGHSNAVWSVLYSNDDRYIVSNSWDRTTRVWEVESGRCIQILKHRQSPYAVAWNRDSTRIAVGIQNGSTGIWDVASGRRIGSLKNPGTHAESLA